MPLPTSCRGIKSQKDNKNVPICITESQNCAYVVFCYIHNSFTFVSELDFPMAELDLAGLGVQQYGKKRIAIYCNMANPFCNTYCNMLCPTIPTDMWHIWPLIWNPKCNSRKIVRLHGILYSIFPR